MSAFWSVAADAAVFVLWLVVSLPRGLGRSERPWTSTVPMLGGSQPATHAWSRFHLRS